MRVLGLDIGGSTTRARLAQDGEIVAEAQSGSASWSAAGPERAGEALRDVLGRIPGIHHQPLDAVCAGSAGSATPTADAWLRSTLAELTGAPIVSVVSDAELVLPAAGHTAGIALICGTGSIVFGSDGTRSTRGGGWGYLLGDECGGFWVVRTALRTLLDRRDRKIPCGSLGEALMTSWARQAEFRPHSLDRPALRADADPDMLDRLLSDFYRDPTPSRWAAYASDVLDCADPELPAMIEPGARRLVSSARSVAHHLKLADAPIVMAGGLSGQPIIAGQIRAQLESRLRGHPIEHLEAPPVAGATALAMAAARSRINPTSNRSPPAG